MKNYQSTKPNPKYRAKEDTRLYVLHENRSRVSIIPIEKGELFKLRKGQTFFEGHPKELKESRW